MACSARVPLEEAEDDSELPDDDTTEDDNDGRDDSGCENGAWSGMLVEIFSCMACLIRATHKP